MKKLKFLLLVPILLAFGACDSELELEPQQSLSIPAAFSDKNTAIGSLAGVYSRTQSFYVFGVLPQAIADFQSDNVFFVGSFPDLQDISRYTATSANGVLQTAFLHHYRAIFAANAVIDKTDAVADLAYTAEEKAQSIAEAKVLRAMVYFQMANLWGQPWAVSNGASPAVPLSLDSFDGTVTFPARATVADIYAQVITDLTASIPHLPNSLATKGKVSAGAAQGLLSRLYLYQGEWQKSADMAQNVISASEFSLASNYSFHGNSESAISSEEVFTLINSATDNGRIGSGGWGEYYNPASLGGRGDCPFSDEFFAAYDADDKRLSTLFKMGPAADGGTIRPFSDKFPDASTHSDNVPLVRVTEMYLNRAEALAELNGVNAESLTLINALRTRAGLSNFTSGDFSSAENFLDAIAVERRKELAFEGHRRMDLLRRGKALRTSGPGVGISSPGDNFIVLPIPQREIDVNPNMTQNPGY